MKESRLLSAVSLPRSHAVFRSGPTALLAFIWLYAGLIGSSGVSVGASQLAFTWTQETAAKAQTESEPRTLALGQLTERELAGGGIHQYQILLAAGQYLRATVEQKGIDVVVTAYQPDGGKLAEVDSPNGSQGPEPVALIAPTAGTYRLTVHSLEKDAAPGRYEIKIEELRPATEEDRIRIQAQKLFAEAEELKNLGTRDSLPKAVEKAQASLPLWQVLKDQRREAQTLNKIGYLYYHLAEYQKSLDNLQRALPLWRAAQDREGEADTLTNIGAAYRDTGRQKQALEAYFAGRTSWNRTWRKPANK